jgi:hypothetical protein
MVIVIFFLALNTSRAVLPVTDAGLNAQTAAHHLVDFAKWAKTEVDAAQTQINTLQTYENTVLQVARYGNPSALRNIPVIGSIAQLVGTGQQVMYNYQRLQALAQPQYLQGQLSSLTNQYQLYNWNPMVPGTYQFYTAGWQVSQSTQEQMYQLERQRQNLEQQRDQLLNQIANASTSSEVQKYSAALNGVNGALAEVSARAHEAALQNQLQQDQLRAGREVQKQQTIEMNGAAFIQDTNNSINMLQNLSVGYGSVPRWNQ